MQRKAELETVANKRRGFAQRVAFNERRAQEEVKAAETEEEYKANFFSELEQSKDLADNLPGLVHFLKKYTDATGVYIGRLQYPERKIKIDDDDKAHLDYDKPMVVKYLHASSDENSELEDHKFVEGTVLKPNEGLTHDVFGADYARLEA